MWRMNTVVFTTSFSEAPRFLSSSGKIRECLAQLTADAARNKLAFLQTNLASTRPTNRRFRNDGVYGPTGCSWFLRRHRIDLRIGPIDGQ